MLSLKTFLSYNFSDLGFVRLVYKYLEQQRPSIDPYFFEVHQTSDLWETQIMDALQEAKAFVLFLGDTLGETQKVEIGAVGLYKVLQKKIVWVSLSHTPDMSWEPAVRMTEQRNDISPLNQFRVLDDQAAYYCAQRITELLGVKWASPEDVPADYVFDYEKHIISEALERPTSLNDAWVPNPWPAVERMNIERKVQNPVTPSMIGDYRRDDACIILDARAGTGSSKLTFPEAGPREWHCYPNPLRKLYGSGIRVGIIVSGGIAPGINAVIDGIVNRHWLYAQGTYQPEIYGYLEGFKALLRGARNYVELVPDTPSNLPFGGGAMLATKALADKGGSMLGTSRAQELLDGTPKQRADKVQAIIDTLRNEHIELLYILGGDGSMRAAHAIWTIARKSYPNLSVIGIPKTMDNDILWVWQSFGFLSAVEKAKEAILLMQTEVRSNPRLCVIQLFGSYSGFVVANAVLASGDCDYALIPEVPFSMKTVGDHIESKLTARFAKDKRPYGMVVMSETAIPEDVDKYIDEVDLTSEERQAIANFIKIRKEGRRLKGQAPDALRTGGLKIVSKVLEKRIREIQLNNNYWRDFRVVTNEPRHTIRSIPPSAWDVIFGQRLGGLAVDNAMAGYTDFMISQWLTEYVLVPLKLVVLGRKRLTQNGIFWKSVLASTGQPTERIPVADQQPLAVDDASLTKT